MKIDTNTICGCEDNDFCVKFYENIGVLSEKAFNHLYEFNTYEDLLSGIITSGLIILPSQGDSGVVGVKEPDTTKRGVYMYDNGVWKMYVDTYSEDIIAELNQKSTATNLENGTGTGSLVQKTVSSSGTPYANESSGSGSVALGKKIKSKGNTTFVIGQENEAIVGTSASFTSGRLNINRGSYNLTGGENNANNNSWNLVIGKNNAVSDGRFGIVSGLNNEYCGGGNDENSSISMLGNNLYYVQSDSSSYGALLIGRYNRVQNNPGRLFIVGNGNSAEDRKNAFEVLGDGRAKVQSAPVEGDDVVRKIELNTLDTKINELYVSQEMAATLF